MRLQGGSPAALMNLSACGKKGIDENEIPDSTGGTEIVKIKDDDGFDYVLSARVSANIDEAFNLVKICRA